MNDLNLSKIHELMSFNDVFTSDNEYMKAAGKLPHIALETTPLYKVDTNAAVLFTPKLRYYRIAVENEVNRHLNASNALLASDGDNGLTDFILKKTREAVQTLTHDASRELSYLNPDGEIWLKLCSPQPDFLSTDKNITEEIVFLHYVTAELIRCWLELQDRHTQNDGTAGLFDIPLCYSSFANTVPDDIFKLKRFEEEQEEIAEKTKSKVSQTKAKKKSSKAIKPDKEKPYTLAYYTADNDRAYKEQKYRVVLLFKKLTEWKWIAKSTRPDDFDSLFTGKQRHCNIKWTATNSILTYLMKTLLEQPYIRKQTGCSARSIVINQFKKNPDNNYDRLDDTVIAKVKIALYILDICKPLPEKRGASGFSTESDLDTSDKALQEIYSGNMHVGKHT